LDEDVRKTVRGIALLNASEHDGRTRNDAVISKVIGAMPELRARIKEIIPLISEVVGDVNAIPLDKQKSELESSFPELLTAKPRQDRTGLPMLEGAEHGKVVTRFPRSRTVSAHRTCKGRNNRRGICQNVRRKAHLQIRRYQPGK